MSEEINGDPVACGECGLTMAESRMLAALNGHDPIAWETDAGNGLIRYVTDAKYRRFLSAIQAHYRPYTSAPTIPAGYVLLSRSQHAEVVECLHDMATGKGGWSWEEVYQEHRAILDASLKGETA